MSRRAGGKAFGAKVDRGGKCGICGIAEVFGGTEVEYVEFMVA